MTYTENRNVLKIDIDAICGNIDIIKEKTNCDIMAIVKADAYGHGSKSIARAIADKCRFFGVASVDEALELRHSGIENPILVLGPTPICRFLDAANHGITLTIFDIDSAAELSATAQSLNKSIPYHIAVDTGMNRIGFKVDEKSRDICIEISRLKGIYPEGIFSHFATADSSDLERTHRQKKLFDKFIKMLSDKGLDIPVKHIENSAGILDFGSSYNMVRSGIITYGLYPSREVKRSIDGLIPAMSWESYVSYIKTVPAGEEIGYGGTYKTEKDTVVATLPVGYADGYPWSLSGKFYVLINGKRAPILGRVCMDLMMVDVSEIKNIKIGDKVTLVGKNGNESISVEEISEASGSFSYEFICGISRRVTRLYFKNGEVFKKVNYLEK